MTGVRLTLDPGWLMLSLMAAARVAGVLAFTPVLGFTSLPNHIRVMLVLAVGLLVASAVPASPALAAPETLLGLARDMGRELILGGVLGFGILTAFGALAVGGRLLDYQIGFGIATLFDPTTRAQASLMGTVLAMLGAVIFLTLDAHHTLIRGLAYSFQAVPVGKAFLLPSELFVAQFGLMFVHGLVLVAPAVFALLLMDLVIGFASRLMPQVNAYFIAMPAKALTGIVVTAVSLRFSGDLLESFFEQIFVYWQQALAAGSHG